MSSFVTQYQHSKMIETLISSKTRVKLLLKFFLNSNTTAYLRSLENEFGESSNAIRLELNRLEKAGMLSSFVKGNKKMFQANTQHPLYGEVHNIMRKHIGLDQIVENVIERLGDIEQVFLAGEFADGVDSSIIDLIFIGNIDEIYLVRLIHKAEKLVKRKIRYLIYSADEWQAQNIATFSPQPIPLWSK